MVPSPRTGTPATNPTSSSSAFDPPAAQQMTSGGVGSSEVVPETATRTPGESYENFHTGRGGQGNVHRDKYGGHSKAQHDHQHSHQQQEGGKGEGFVEKVKHALGGHKEREAGS